MNSKNPERMPRIIKAEDAGAIEFYNAALISLVSSTAVDWDKLAEEVIAADQRQEGDPYNDPKKILNGLKKLLKQDRLGLWFDDCRGDEQYQAFKVDEKHAPDPEKDDVWFFGDIKGDLLGMLAAIEYAEKKSAEDGKNPHYVFLGDYTNRGPFDYLVLLKLYSMVLDENLRNRICIIAGNLDECLEYNEEKKEFYATVVPAEFTDWLNDRKEDEVWQELGKATIEFFKRMPRAIFLPDGLFFAHAGVPHTDLHGNLDSLEALNEPLCLQDFVWSRASERGPRRRPNRTTRGWIFGRKDFYAFCEIAGKVLGQPVERMLRGHDLYLEGHRHYEKYVENQMLTLNTRCIQPDMIGGPHAPFLCVARWEQGKLPKVHQIDTDQAALEKAYPAPTEPEPEVDPVEEELRQAQEAVSQAQEKLRQAEEAKAERLQKEEERKKAERKQQEEERKKAERKQQEEEAERLRMEEEERKEREKLGRKCLSCGYMHPIDHASECTGCGAAGELLFNTCKKHPDVIIGSAPNCRICEQEQNDLNNPMNSENPGN